MAIDVPLPPPWPSGSVFSLSEPRAITWLVGANGTGKSRFLRALRDHRSLTALNPRLVSTDRLSTARSDETMRGMWGDRIGGGLPKSQFPSFLAANHRDGAIVGTVALLYERPDLRIRLEATLSQLLDRHVRLEMVDGNLLPKVRCGSSPEYGMLSDECHGVLELLVLLANIYDEKAQILLIDEPEQHLHPQYQAFVLEELRRTGKRAVLATHSSSFLRVKTLDDLHNVVCFHEDFRLPSVYHADDRVDREVQEILPRMTEQHRGFFFAKRPVFVEGYFDATLIGAILGSLGLSAEAAGSCIIPALGKDEAGRYLMLCNGLGKQATFVFDLDALFDRRLRTGAGQHPELESRVAGAGHGDYGRLVGQLQRALTDAVGKVEGLTHDQAPAAMKPLRVCLATNSGPDNLDKRRLALLVALADQPTGLRTMIGADADAIQGFLRAVLDHLASVDIHVLPGGALENYAPSYVGDRFKVPDEAKRVTVIQEQAWLATNPTQADIRHRYGALVEIIQKLPARPRVDIRPTIQRELAHTLHHLIMAVRAGQVSKTSEVASVLGEDWRRVANFVEVRELGVRSVSDFSGTIVVLDRFGLGEQWCGFDNHTQTNDPNGLKLEPPRAVPAR